MQQKRNGVKAGQKGRTQRRLALLLAFFMLFAVAPEMTLATDMQGRVAPAVEPTAAPTETPEQTNEIVTLTPTPAPEAALAPIPELSPSPTATAAAAASATAKSEYPTDGYVNAADVNVRTGDNQSLESIARLAIGTPVTVKGCENGWYIVSVESIETGYIRMDYVTIGKAPEQIDAKIPVTVTPSSEQFEDEIPLCVCTVKCGEETINADCPVCAADFTACRGIEQVEKNIPLYELTDHALEALETADGDKIDIAGLLPKNAYISAQKVELSEAAELAGAQSEAEVLFAYDIKIMVPAGEEGGAPTEYQPGIPVTVTITPPKDKPVEAPVKVTHIDDSNNAEVIAVGAQPVAGAVEFPAESFSVYIVTLNPGTGYTVTIDAEAGYTVTDTDGVAFADEDTGTSNTIGVTVIGTDSLSFKVAGEAPGVYRSGAGGALSYDSATGVYTLSAITASTTIKIAQYITFYLEQQSVTIDATAFSGKDASGASMTGPHTNANKYKVTQADINTVTANRIILTGAASATNAPSFDLTLHNVNCAEANNVTSTNTPEGGIVAGVDQGTNLHRHITLRLSGTNSIGRI